MKSNYNKMLLIFTTISNEKIDQKRQKITMNETYN